MYPDIPWLIIFTNLFVLWLGVTVAVSLITRHRFTVAMLESAALIASTALLLGGIIFIHTH